MATQPDPHRPEKGQATLEFIIIVPMMLLMISLVLCAGWWSYGKLSAQNAAYAYGVWNPLTQIGLGFGRLANVDAAGATLREPIGMKPMWAEDIPSWYESDPYLYTRLGGTGTTIAVSPRGLGWDEYGQIWGALGSEGGGEVDLPKASAFFYYSPFMSADQ